jgi:hemerythrin-like domain-containing protein
MNILNELKKDHKQVKALCKRIKKEEDGPAKRRLKSFLQLADLLDRHTMAEEEALYERIKPEGSKGKDLALEGYEEHHVADVLIGELKNLAVEDEHHIDEEEEEMFEVARKLGTKELNKAGKEFLELRNVADAIAPKGTFSGAQKRQAPPAHP